MSEWRLITFHLHTLVASGVVFRLLCGKGANIEARKNDGLQCSPVVWNFIYFINIIIFSLTLRVTIHITHQR